MSQASTTGSMQHVFLTFSQVSKENWQSRYNLVENNAFEYRINCILDLLDIIAYDLLMMLALLSAP